MVCARCGENSFVIPDRDHEFVICTFCREKYATLGELKKRVADEFGPRS
jgi:hypothetical protein